MGVLNVLPLCGGDHLCGHVGQKVSAESPVPFSICSTYIATSVWDVIQSTLQVWRKCEAGFVPCHLSLISSWSLNVDENEY